jgi:GR25 family glycosyltransferase involved in LPS biosynthesis
MPIPVLIITYERFDFVIQILEKLKSNSLSCVYITVDDYYRDEKGFNDVEKYLTSHQFKYQVLKWDRNVGCDFNIMEGIKWFFTHVDNGFIFEDDCVPTENFSTFLKLITKPELVDKTISLFSTNVTDPKSFFMEASYIPSFWGWYSNRDYFDEFYRFYHATQSGFNNIFKLWAKDMPAKLKIIALINFYAHRGMQKGLCWDSELFLFQILRNKPFLVPSYSLIDNLGFGELNASHTHTFKVPDWYKKISFKEIKKDVTEIPINGLNSSNNNTFLNFFYADYSNNKIKLILTLCKMYIRYKVILPKSKIMRGLSFTNKNSSK